MDTKFAEPQLASTAIAAPATSPTVSQDTKLVIDPATPKQGSTTEHTADSNNKQSELSGQDNSTDKDTNVSEPCNQMDTADATKPETPFGTATADTSAGKTAPDSDSGKMFVGQIPRSMTEDELREMFEKFGSVFELAVIKDKDTGQSKGCCFVTFHTRKAAMEAKTALHNVHKMPGMPNPIQMKPANVEERKLFVGMLSRNAVEDDVREMLLPFGHVEECTVLRDHSGQSKGCAFVTFTNRASCLNAIRTLHHSKTMEGSRSPIVVKFAGVPREKVMKSIQQVQANYVNQSGMARLNTLTRSQPIPVVNRQARNISNPPNVRTLLNNPGGMNMLQAQQALVNMNMAASRQFNDSQQNPGGVNTLQALQNLQGLAVLAAMANAGNMGARNNPNMGPQNMTNTANLSGIGGIQNRLVQNRTSLANVPPVGLNNVCNNTLVTQGRQGINVPNQTTQRINQLPSSSNMPVQGFQGNTSNPGSVQAAVQALNSFQTRMNRLKFVQNRPRNENKPY